MSDDSKLNMFIHYENAKLNAPKPPLPVTVVTGFLGSGKTTLLSHILQRRENLKIGVAINDFSDIDSEAIRKKIAEYNKSTTQAQIVEITNDVVSVTDGCACCTASEDLKNKLWFAHKNSLESGKINYMIVETSGITDPRKIISIMDENFGKMYHIRLDSIVTVVDTDRVYHNLIINHKSLSKAERSQLECADVILLNKTDLVSTTQLSEVHNFVRKYSPRSTLYNTTYSRIPLQYILDVDDQQFVVQGVSHEATVKEFKVSSTGKKHRIGAENDVHHHDHNDHNHNHDHSNDNDHMIVDGFSSYVFNSDKPLELYKFQEWLRNLPDDVVRAKGTIYFSEEKLSRYLFHISGRKRFGISPDGNWDSAPYVKLVIVGKNLGSSTAKTTTPTAITTATTTAITPTTTAISELSQKHRNVIQELENCVIQSQQELREIRKSRDNRTFEDLVKSDFRFQYLKTLNNIVYFRITGAEACGFTNEAAQTLHGINFSTINTRFMQTINSLNGRLFFSCSISMENSELWLKYSQEASEGKTGEENLDEIWNSISGIANKLIEEFYGNICGCKRFW